MNKRTFLLVTGLGLALTACGDEDEVVDNDPIQEPDIQENPPPPEMPDGPVLPGGEEGTEAGGELPTWDEVKSGHPEGATNPPMPELVVTPDGAHCYKNWRAAMRPPEPGEVWGDRVQECAPDECGTEIECPEDRARELLEAAKPDISKNPPPPMPPG